MNEIMINIQEFASSSIWLCLALLSLGICLLVVGGERLVVGGLGVAKAFKVKTVIIGLTIIAFSTSSPELAFNVFAACSGNSEITIGNIFGSNIANLALVLGIGALIHNRILKKVDKKKPYTPISPYLRKTIGNWLLYSTFGISVIVTIFIFVGNEADSFFKLDWIWGCLMLIVFLVFFLFFRNHEEEGDGEGVMLKTWHSNYPLLLPILYLVAGLLLLGVGGKISEIAAVQGALLLGVSEMYIGVTIVALATSLPELVTTIIAVLKKQPGLAWGNIFGSNLFNILFVLPITMIVIGVPMFRGNEVDGYIHLTGNPPIVIEPFIYMISMLTITTITFWFMRNGTKNRKEISNKEGVCLITFYALFIVGITIWKSMR